MRKFIRYSFLSVAGSLKTPMPGIHILNSHFVSPEKLTITHDLEKFDWFLFQLNKIAQFIPLEEAVLRIIQGDIEEKKVLISFTFDDGFEECHSVIAPILEKYKTRGAFFINGNYIDSSLEYQVSFNQRTNTYSKQPMSWDQVKNLHQRGHLIASHGMDHCNFGELSETEILTQVSDNKRILESKLDFQCDYFAWTYGQFKHFPEYALEIVKQHHKYIFSATNYKDYLSMDGQIINRRHIEPFWPIPHCKYFLSTQKKY